MLHCTYFLWIITCFAIKISENKPLDTKIRSDVIVTSGFNVKPNHENNGISNQSTVDVQKIEPGWLRRHLKRFGDMFGSIGNSLGGFTGRVTNALDKLCDVIKTIIPVVAAVCHVGQFKFCGSVMDAPKELAEVLAPNNLDLSIPD